MKYLDQIRRQIDSIDEDLIRLLSKRGRLATEVGRIKKEKGKPIYVPSREKVVFDRIVSLNRGPYKTESLLAIFREIISATRALEAPIRVCYLGPEATFTHMAAEIYFGSSADFISLPGIQVIFEEVAKSHEDYGVVPIENSTEGVVNHTLDMFSHSTLSVCGEVVLRVNHHLLSGLTDLKRVKWIYSHPHALAQCRNWLALNLPHARFQEVDSTALAARKASLDRYSAAIASEIASRVYKIPILKTQIQDQSQNFTRFLVIGHHGAKKTGRDKTSILFVAHDEVGALYRILGVFARANVNLSKIESRPLKKRAWEYMFFADLDGHVEDGRIDRALKKVRRECSYFQLLGSYPVSRTFN